MEFKDFILDILNDYDTYVIGFVVFLFVLLYLFLFRKQIWGVFDPLVYASLMMGGSAFCVYFMYLNYDLDSKYFYSFLSTELALIIGIILFYSISSRKSGTYELQTSLTKKKADKLFVDIYLYIIASLYFLVQIISFLVVGVVVLEEDVNHASAYEGHAYIQVAVLGTRAVFIVVLLYKYFCYKLSYFDKLLFFFYFVTIALGGAKSAILPPIIYFFILNYYFSKKEGRKMTKVKLIWLIPIALFPALVLYARTGADFQILLSMYGARIIGAGDVFVMGYDDHVIRSFSGNTLINYIFFPFSGVILKNLGFSITPTPVLGKQIYEYYYGVALAAPNARHNYLGLVFLGPYFSIIYSFLCGSLIGYIRGSFLVKNRSFSSLVLYTLLYYMVLDVITDIYVFTLFFFWAVVTFTLVYFLARIIYEFVNQSNYTLTNIK